MQKTYKNLYRISKLTGNEEKPHMQNHALNFIKQTLQTELERLLAVFMGSERLLDQENAINVANFH